MNDHQANLLTDTRFKNIVVLAPVHAFVQLSLYWNLSSTNLLHLCAHSSHVRRQGTHLSEAVYYMHLL